MKNSIILVSRVNRKTKTYKKHPHYTRIYKTLRKQKGPIVKDV